MQASVGPILQRNVLPTDKLFSQETKLRSDNVPTELLDLKDWHSIWYCSEKKGWMQLLQLKLLAARFAVCFKNYFAFA